MTPAPRVGGADIIARLSGLAYPERLAAAAEMWRELDAPFSPALADAVLAQLGADGPEQAMHLDAWLASLPASAAASYVRAVHHARAGRHDRAAEAWRDLVQRVPYLDPLLAAQRARSQAAISDWAGAARTLRQALAARPAYTFYARTQAFIRDVAAHDARAVREARIAVLGSATTSLLIPILRALSFRDRIAAEFYEGAFGAFRQEILDPHGALAAFRPTVVFIAPHWRDLELPPIASGDPASIAQRVVDEYRGLWGRLHASFDCHVVQHTFDLPADESAGLLAGQLETGRARLIRRINDAMAEARPRGVSLLDTEQVVARAGADRWSDPRLWYLARQPPS